MKDMNLDCLLETEMNNHALSLLCQGCMLSAYMKVDLRIVSLLSSNCDILNAIYPISTTCVLEGGLWHVVYLEKQVLTGLKIRNS